jgi:hypothetical protein
LPDLQATVLGFGMLSCKVKLKAAAASDCIFCYSYFLCFLWFFTDDISLIEIQLADGGSRNFPQAFL